MPKNGRKNKKKEFRRVGDRMEKKKSFFQARLPDDNIGVHHGLLTRDVAEALQFCEHEANATTVFAQTDSIN